MAKEKKTPPPIERHWIPKSMREVEFFRSSRFRRLFKESIWIVLGQAMSVLGLLVGVRLLTELLDPAAYGELALGMTLATLVNQIIFGPLGNGIMRFYAPAVEQGHLGSYISAVRSLVGSAVAVIALMILLGSFGLLVTGKAQWLAIVVAALVFATLGGCNSILSGIQIAARQRSIVALHQGMESWARFLIAAGLMVWLGASSSVAMTGYAVAALMVLGSQYVFFQKISAGTNTADIKQDWRGPILKFSWPFATFGIFAWMQLVSDRWALEFFSTRQEVGLYAVLFQLGYYPMALVNGMAMQLLVPIFYQRAGDGSDSLRNANVSSLSWRLTWLTLALTGAAFLAAYMLHTQIFHFFVAKEYQSVSYLLPWMLFSGGVLAAAQTITLNLMSQMKAHTMMAAKIITALLGIALNCAGAYWYGTSGVVIASVLFSVSFFSWMALLSKQEEVKKCL